MCIIAYINASIHEWSTSTYVLYYYNNFCVCLDVCVSIRFTLITSDPLELNSLMKLSMRNVYSQGRTKPKRKHFGSRKKEILEKIMKNSRKSQEKIAVKKYQKIRLEISSLLSSKLLWTPF